MTNLDSSWQSSVVKLAQAGNLRAIAFWLNRYLVPQGICAQVLADQPGHLIVRVMCHREPDGDRLFQFLCERLNQLNSDLIRSVRITAQLVGSAKPLWEKSAQIVPNGKTEPSDDGDAEFNLDNIYLQSNLQSNPQSTPVVNEPSLVGGDRQSVAVGTGKTAMLSKPQPSVSIRSAPTPIPPRQPVVTPIPPSVRSRKMAPGRPIRPKKASSSQMFRFKRWTRIAGRQTVKVTELVRRSTSEFLEWFTHQTPPVRILTLSSSAIAVFFIGAGFELLRHYSLAPTFQQTQHPEIPASDGSIPAIGGNTIATALGRVPVIQPSVLNPDDPTITLLFSNSAALDRTSTYGESSTGTVYPQADLTMTSLDRLSASPSSQPVPPQTYAPTPSPTSTEAIPEKAISENQESLDAEPFNEETENEAENEEVAASEVPESEIPLTQPDSAQISSQIGIQDLLTNGVDIVNLANSEQVDATASMSTLNVLQQNTIHSIGVGQTPEDARRPLIFEVKGQRIAYLGYSDPSLSAQLSEAAGIVDMGSFTKQITEDIQAIQEQVDWVIVSFQWQRTLKAYPEDWQVSLAHHAIDQGADLIVGYHPTFTQGAEIYKGRAIVYALGSSVDEYSDYSATDRDAITLRVTLHDQQMQLEFLPIQIRQGQATVVEGDSAAPILSYLEQASSLFDQPMRSRTTLDTRMRLSLPSAPEDDTLPTTDSFISYPDEPIESLLNDH